MWLSTLRHQLTPVVRKLERQSPNQGHSPKRKRQLTARQSHASHQAAKPFHENRTYQQAENRLSIGKPRIVSARELIGVIRQDAIILNSMPTIFSHSIAALAVGKAVAPPGMPAKFWVASALCAALPDIECC